jgi:integrase
MATRPRGNNDDAAKTKYVGLTDRRVEALEIKEKTYAIYDSKTAAFGVRVLPTGGKTFFWFRGVRGKPVWRNIGQHPAIPVDTARLKADEYNGTLATWKKERYAGANPFDENALPGRLTLDALVERYISDHVMLFWKNKENGAKTVRKRIELYLSDWRGREISDISAADVFARYSKLWKEIGGTTANRIIDMVRGMYKFSEDAELFSGKNPARIPAKKRYKEVGRKRYLEPTELKRLLSVCDAYQNDRPEHRDLAHWTLFSLATGQRKNTVLKARWAAIDLDAATWHLEPHETKNKQEFVCLLSPRAVRVLTDRKKHAEGEFVFPGKNPKRPRHDFFFGAWATFLKKAGLAHPRNSKMNFRMHDLRHTYISYQVMNGSSLAQAAAAVGHASLRSTERYSHLSPSVTREVVMGGEREIERRIAAVREP